MKYLIGLLLCVSAHAAPLVNPSDINNLISQDWTFNALVQQSSTTLLKEVQFSSNSYYVNGTSISANNLSIGNVGASNPVIEIGPSNYLGLGTYSGGIVFNGNQSFNQSSLIDTTINFNSAGVNYGTIFAGYQNSYGAFSFEDDISFTVPIDAYFDGVKYVTLINVPGLVPMSAGVGLNVSPDAMFQIISSTGPKNYVVDASSNNNTTKLFTVNGEGDLFVSSGAFISVSLSTQAAGSAGSLVTVSCVSGSFTFSGGCSCSGAVATTSVINMPYPTITVSGNMPTGWQCQEAGTTGGACSAYVICSRIRF